MVGAGTMAGYEAMQRGAYGGGSGSGIDDASPQVPPPQGNDPYGSQAGGSGGQQDGDVWGEGRDPWDNGGGGPPPAGGAGGEGGGEGGGGGGLLDAISDFFGD